MPEHWILRRASLDDTESIHSQLCKPKVYRYLADNKKPSIHVIEDWLEKSAIDFERFGVGLWILNKHDEQVSGCVSLAVDEPARSAELVYLLDPALWGQGLATRMGWTAITVALKKDVVDRIVAGADVPNLASIAVIKRLGMQFWREVEYPLGKGVEYVYDRKQAPPVPIPELLSLE